MILFIPSTVANALRSCTLALRSLWLHKMRAFLSVLGIIIGTGAVIALMAFGEGSMQDALEDIKSQGATNIIIRSVKPADKATSNTKGSFYVAYGLTPVDFKAMDTLPTIIRKVPMTDLIPKTRLADIRDTRIQEKSVWASAASSLVRSSANP